MLSATVQVTPVLFHATYVHNNEAAVTEEEKANAVVVELLVGQVEFCWRNVIAMSLITCQL